MAEFVQESREQMLEELEQLERLGIFEKHETRTILKKRTAFEYRLNRQKKEKADYLQYVQYEISVLALIRKRRERLRVRQKQQEIEVNIRMRIHRLFKAACFRFQADEKLWLSYIEWAKSKKEKSTVSKLYVRMLQIHNRKPEVWVSAAKHEMDTCKSMENARSLLQRGIRFNGESQTLWREYFRMELLNAELLRERKQILDNAALKADDYSDDVLGGKAAEAVFKSAMQNFTDKGAEFALSLIPICQLFDFAKHITELIYQYLSEHHGKEEVTYDAVARRHLHNIDAVVMDTDLDDDQRRMQVQECEQECYSTYDQAVKSLQTEKMYDLYLTFCLERVGKVKKKKKSSQISSDQEKTLSVFEQAADCQCLSENMAVNWMKLLRKLADTNRLSSCMSHVTTLHKSSLAVRKQHLSYSILLHGEDYQQVYDVFMDAVKCVKDNLPLWEVTREWLQLVHPKQVVSFLEFGLSSTPEVNSKVKEWYLESAVLEGDITKVRQLYKRLSPMQPVSIEFFTKYIDTEMSQPTPSMKRVRGAYNDALREYGTTNPDLWIKIIKLEMTHPSGEPTNAGQLHWTAVKALEGQLNEEFIKQYTLLQTQPL